MLELAVSSDYVFTSAYKQLAESDNEFASSILQLTLSVPN
jgi:hypothetical protein